MAVTTGVYYSYLKGQEDGHALDLDTDTLKCALFTISGSGTVANLSSTSYATLTGECAASGNYSTGGVTITGQSISGTATVKITCGAVTFTNITTTARYAVIYKVTSNELIEYIDFGADQSPVGQNMVITPNASGLLSKTVV